MVKTQPLPHYRAMFGPPPPLVTRSRPWWSTAAFLTAGIAVVQLGTRAVLWFLPYHVAGFVNEVVLLAMACLIGLALFLIRRRLISPPPARLAVVAASVLYLIASSAGLGWSKQSGLGLGANEYALFSTPQCEFAARFDRPPRYGRVKGVLSIDESPGEKPLLYVAVLADIATATAFRAECLPLPAGKDSEQIARQLMPGLSQWTDESGIKVTAATLRSDERGKIFVLDGEIGGSILPEQEGKRSKTLVGLRSYVGSRSVMMVYVFQPRGDTLSPEAVAFLDGVRLR